jgi:diguanylate cyclase (GGDEF)-like protein
VRSFFGLASWLLGSVFSMFIERADRRDFRHREMLHAMAQRDPLTGLFNRRGLDERFALLLASARRDGSPLSLAIVDLDHFKAYNDNYGHDAGDAVLVAVSGVLARHARRPLDVVARLGGEEFLLAWHDAGPLTPRGWPTPSATACTPSACHTGHRRLTAHVTASVGVTTRQPVQDSDSLDSLYRSADTALYAAKHQGRNRVCVAAESIAVPGDSA